MPPALTLRPRTLLLVLALGPTPLRAQAKPVLPGDDLVGLWGAEAVFGPAVHGELLLERSGNRFTVRVGGLEAAAAAKGDSLVIVLPGGAGTLRARIAGRAVHAMWIQPAGISPAYASPVHLVPVRPNAWRGAVKPIDERFSIYLLFRRQPDGSITAVFRNPEAGWNVGRTYRVGRDGDNLAFTDIATGKVRWRQAYDSSQRTIAFEFGAPVLLHPMSRAEARGFAPRVQAESAYTYRAPLASADGWPTASAGATGMNEARLAELVERIVRMDPASDSTQFVHSVLVAHRGLLVLEEYFYGFRGDQPHDTRSAFKTMTSLMVGAAIDRGARFTVASPVYPIFGLDSLMRIDPRRAQVTVGQLLTHSTGLACDDNDDASPGNEDKLQQGPRHDWYRYMLELPMAHAPGSTYAYCTGTVHLAAGVVARTTHRWLPEFFDDAFARPLGIRDYAINLAPDGEGYGGGGTYLRPRDLLKFGQLVLAGGMWNGARVVSKAWLERSTAHQAATPDGGSDGFGWHRHTLRLDGRDYQEFEANGNGGQFLIVVPALDLAVVFTAGNYNRYRVWRVLRDEFVPRYIMGSVSSSPGSRRTQ